MSIIFPCRNRDVGHSAIVRIHNRSVCHSIGAFQAILPGVAHMVVPA